MYPGNGHHEKSPIPEPLQYPAQGTQFHQSIPNQSVPNGSIPGQWTTGICDCCEDPCHSCITWCFPCVTFGQIAEVLDQGTTSCGAAGCLYYLMGSIGCICLYASGYRAKLRSQYQLQEAPCNDCLVHWCCTACALCQEYRELRNRGVDPSLGWQGNVAKWNRGATAAPVVAQAMTR
ncbi:protein PLANT CADMIUM RESISTANCE 3-like [Aristolochia californica]|uniref:protein PLANT CADMIUM RESISTANCE 3-like n=1 Tax=Aristolochia californica TaxID=171875 RepID=UPI0035E1EDA1